MNKNNIFAFLIFFVFSGSLYPQTTKEEVLSNINNACGLYCPYIYSNSAQTPAPEGYTPFYISHYGRHGSRWVISPDCHVVPQKILNIALKDGKLTEKGKALLEQINILAADAEGRYGDLSPLGAREHRGIAERMFRNFPQVFSTEGSRKCFIYSRSTQVPRCILSMSAFDERLKELNPNISIVRDASMRDKYLCNDAELKKDTLKKIETSFLKQQLNTHRFIAQLFNDTLYAEQKITDPGKFAYQVFSAAINLPNLDGLNVSLFDFFTPDEIFVLWQYSNMHMYYLVGPSGVNGKNAVQSASLLLKNIIDCADSAINNGDVSADLRFGHDSYIIPLLALMDIKDMNIREDNPDKIYTAWSTFKASPMGSNLQLVFYKNNKTDDVLVKLLHCEKEVQVPVKTDIFPYYHWKALKAYYTAKITK
jgi:hypothetical protein